MHTFVLATVISIREKDLKFKPLDDIRNLTLTEALTTDH